jgi:hypothetical protein
MVPNRNGGHNTKLQILNQPNNGLDRNIRQAVVETPKTVHDESKKRI